MVNEWVTYLEEREVYLYKLPGKFLLSMAQGYLVEKTYRIIPTKRLYVFVWQSMGVVSFILITNRPICLGKLVGSWIDTLTRTTNCNCRAVSSNPGPGEWLSSSDVNLCKQFKPRLGPTEHRSWSDTKPFDTDSVLGEFFGKKLIFLSK